MRSGKSRFAERLAAHLAGDGVLYLATARPSDPEMAARIARHRAERPAAWRTLEAPGAVAAALAALSPPPALVLLEDLGLLLGNLLTAEGAGAPLPADEAEARLAAELSALLDWRAAAGAHLIVVSNEVGLALVPTNPLGRAFADILGRANQRLARTADAAYLLIAGLPLDLHRLRASLPWEEG
jgi:adenosyl cobinamide kinase/adenosyl cobinamide phosphate guanylyltransferase